MAKAIAIPIVRKREIRLIHAEAARATLACARYGEKLAGRFCRPGNISPVVLGNPETGFCFFGVGPEKVKAFFEGISITGLAGAAAGWQAGRPAPCSKLERCAHGCGTAS